jgi:hypothetical protein
MPTKIHRIGHSFCLAMTTLYRYHGSVLAGTPPLPALLPLADGGTVT